MKKIDVILMCYGKDALEQNFEIEIRGVLYTAWFIEEIATKEELKKVISKKQIIDIYESGIWIYIKFISKYRLLIHIET